MNNIKAVIMAGGEGSRLKPLTCKKPKPLVPVIGKPTMSHILDLLQNNGISDVAVTTMYLSDKIKSYYGNNYNNLKLNYFEEISPLGTAGSVKNAEKFLDSDFIVISGDAICNFDLEKAIKFHYDNSADITIILSKTTNPLEYGVVLCDANGKIERFIEKPSWSQAFSDTVNTGIYIINRNILNEIPKDTSYDFGKDLFKKLLHEEKALYGYVSDGYWCDIGDIDAFYRCNMQALNNEIKGVLNSTPFKIINNSIMGTNCKIAKTAKINNSILFDNVEIGDNCTIDGAILCDKAKIGINCIVREGCIIGEDSILENNVSLSKGVKIWNDKLIGEGIKLMTNHIFGDIKKDLFDEVGIVGDINTTLSAEYCVKLGGAFSTATKQGRIGVISDSSKGSTLIKEALLCGLHAGGSKSVDFGNGFESMAAFAATHFKLDLLLFITQSDLSENSIQITMYDANGLYPIRSFERSLESALARDDGIKANISKLHEIEKFNGLEFLYYSEIIHSTNSSLKGFKLSLNSTVPSIFLKKILRELGAEIVDNKEDCQIYISINNTGNDIRISENGNSYKYDVDKWHIAAIIEQAEIVNGLSTLILPYTAPYCLEKIAEDNGIIVKKYVSCPSDSGEDDIRGKVSSQIWLNDACFAAVKICTLLHTQNININELAQNIPLFYNKVDEYDTDLKYKAVVLRRLYEEKQKKSNNVKDLSLEEGICLDYKDIGRVHVIPKRKGGFKLLAEAESVEFANEILELSKKRITNIIDGDL